jgi:uncharacterized protein
MSEVNTEPTMEEILSSIKKIISDDSTKGLAAPKPRRAEPRAPSHDELGTPVPEVAGEEEDVLELTTAVEPEPARPVATPAPEAPPPLVSPVAENASRNALSALSSLVVKPDVAGSDTLEGLVREMLRPMLKEWLDANLPEVVERLVAKEVARISGR